MFNENLFSLKFDNFIQNILIIYYLKNKDYSLQENEIAFASISIRNTINIELEILNSLISSIIRPYNIKQIIEDINKYHNLPS